jgi:DNA-binding IclR family transcriptional regulator
MEAAILNALRANEALWLGRDPVGLMTKEVAEQAKLPLSRAQTLLNDMADRGLVHRSTFFWFSAHHQLSQGASERNP